MQVNHTINAAQSKLIEVENPKKPSQTSTINETSGEISEVKDLNHSLTALTSPSYITIQNSNGDAKSPDAKKSPAKSNQNVNNSNTGGVNNGGIPTDNSVSGCDDDDEDDYPPLNEEDIDFAIEMELKRQREGRSPEERELFIKNEPIANIDVNKLMLGSLTDQFSIGCIHFEDCSFPKDFKISDAKTALVVTFKNCENVNYKYIDQKKVSHPDNSSEGLRNVNYGAPVEHIIDAEFLNECFGETLKRKIYASTKLKQKEVNHILKQLQNSNYDIAFTDLDLSGLKLDLEKVPATCNFKFDNCNFSDSAIQLKFDDATIFNNCNLSKSKIKGLNTRAKFNNCNLQKASLQDHEEATFTNCDLSDVNILTANGLPQQIIFEEMTDEQIQDYIQSGQTLSKSFLQYTLPHAEIAKIIIHERSDVKDFSDCKVNLTLVDNAHDLDGYNFTNSVLISYTRNRYDGYDYTFRNCLFDKTKLGEGGYSFYHNSFFDNCIIKQVKKELNNEKTTNNSYKFTNCTITNSSLHDLWEADFEGCCMLGSNIESSIILIRKSNIISSKLKYHERVSEGTVTEAFVGNFANSLFLLTNINEGDYNNNQNYRLNIKKNKFINCNLNGAVKDENLSGDSENNLFYHNRGHEDNTNTKPEFENNEGIVNNTNHTLNELLQEVPVFKYCPDQRKQHIEGFNFSTLTLNDTDFTNAIFINVDLSEACAQKSHLDIDLKKSKNVTVDDFRATLVNKIPYSWKSRVIDWNGRISDTRESQAEPN